MTPNRLTAIAFRCSISAVFTLWLFAPNAQAQTDLGSVASVGLRVCNAGKVDIDVFVAQSGRVASAHIGSAECASVAESGGQIGSVYVGLAFADARGQWGAARRQDLLPDFGIGLLPGIGVLSRANQSVAVRHGNATVSLPMQILFQPRVPKCTTYRSATESLPAGASSAERAAARNLDSMSQSPRTVCESLNYTINVMAYPDSREIAFTKFCEPCEKKAEARVTPEERAARQQRSKAIHEEIGNLAATGSLGALAMDNMTKMADKAAQEEKEEREWQWHKEHPESYTRMNWDEMNLALSKVRNWGRPPEMPEWLTIRGTVSHIQDSLPGASEHWINVYFRESSEQETIENQPVYGAFNVCTSNAQIFEDMFGPDFRSRMIGQVLEVQGEYQRNYCKGWKGSIRVTMARQVHSGKDQSAAGSGVSYGDFLKALAKAEEEEPKKPPVVSMQTQKAEYYRKVWAASHQSPASYDPQWMGQDLVVTGTVSRVEVAPGRPPWVTIYFKESPDATFVVCSPYPDMFQERVGLDLSVLVGKTLEAAGQVESPRCGHKVPKGSIFLGESKRWQVH